jgi:large subunit ribosomal protein L30
LGEVRVTEEKRKCLVAVRVRGIPTASFEVRRTLEMLHLCRTSHATLIDNSAAYLGMLRTAQHYVTWGEVSDEILLALMRQKGRLMGDKRLTDEYAQKLGYKALPDLADAVFRTKVKYKDLQDIKPVFRLHPPSKGYKGKVKKSYAMGGATGYRGEAINDLIRRMI